MRFRTYGRLIAAALLVAGAGCSTTGMKGTPFYTGEYSKRQGPAEQRVNVWPVFYYREPALSVLWPLFELTDDHAAVRPVFSVYGLDRTNRQYNVAWPLAQFDRHAGDNRIVPFFWGDRYFVACPLYWHFGHPWGEEGGTDSLFPVWLLSRDRTNRFSLWLPWPLARVWSEASTAGAGSMLFPLFWHERSDSGAQFYSLLWCSASEPNGEYWRLLPPLYFQTRRGDNSALVTPLWAQGRSGAGPWRAMFPLWYYSGNRSGSHDLFCPWPLLRFWSDETRGQRGSMVLPLYWHEREETASRFLSLAWCSSADEHGYWRVLPPLYFESSNAVRRALFTPVWQRGGSGRDTWQAIAPLWVHRGDETNRSSAYCPWPLAHFWFDRSRGERGSAVLPLYWERRQGAASEFYSLLWLSRADDQGDRWRLLPPLFYQESTATGSLLVTPVWAQGRSATNDWKAIIPLCYWDWRQGSLFSPLWAHWRAGETESWVAPWLLSMKTVRPERGDLFLLGGLARASWGENPGPDYLFPLYYNDPARRLVLSPVWMRWRERGVETSLAPWLLSWSERRADRTDLWMAGGLARASWGEKPGGDYVFPIYYRDDSRLVTPLFGRDDSLDMVYWLTPIAGMRMDEHAGSWLFPVYSHSRTKATGEVNDNYLLLGGRIREGLSTRSWFTPLYYYRNDREPDGGEPLSARSYRYFGKQFWCLPICWYQDTTRIRPARGTAAATNDAAGAGAMLSTNVPVRDRTVAHGAFPLWSYDARSTPAEGRSRVDGTVLLRLYDYRREAGSVSGAPESAGHEYVRSRVLWRLWHYERLNGDVSVDVFPSFTYDHKRDGFRKVSFLWRFLRHERSAAGDRKLDVLFVPLKR